MEWQAARATERRYPIVCILQACPSQPLAICGLQFFGGLINEGAPLGDDIAVPLGAEELETPAGFGRDADM